MRPDLNWGEAIFGPEIPEGAEIEMDNFVFDLSAEVFGPTVFTGHRYRASDDVQPDVIREEG